MPTSILTSLTGHERPTVSKMYPIYGDKTVEKAIAHFEARFGVIVTDAVLWNGNLYIPFDDKKMIERRKENG